MILVAGTAANFYTGGGFNPFFINFGNSEIEEKDLKYVLMETNLEGSLNVQVENDFNESINSIVLKQREEIIETTANKDTKNVSIQKFDNKYYGVYYIGETEKLVLKEIELLFSIDNLLIFSTL